MDFTICGCGGHLGHVIWTIYKLTTPLPMDGHAILEIFDQRTSGPVKTNQTSGPVVSIITI